MSCSVDDTRHTASEEIPDKVKIHECRIRYDEKYNLRYQVSFVKLEHRNDLPNHGVDRNISEVMISTKAEHNPDYIEFM
jgi:hypothetical protein